MVEVLMEPCGQDMAITEKGCNLNGNSIIRLARNDSNLNEPDLTPIQKFYCGQSIFVTGGTGFMGKLLVEKLLRECPGVSNIYLLVRPKKGKDVHERIEELFEDPIFAVLKEKHPKFQHQIVAVAGDCALPGLGMSPADRQMVAQNVTIVFHVAATVRFDEKLKLAVPINVRSPREVLSICKEMPSLKSFVHVSTAYANCPYEYIEEKLYDPPIDAKKLVALVDAVDEKLLDELTPRLLGVWPNTYTFTKAVAENVVMKEAGDLPVGIFRPAIVVSTYTEPIRGWIDNLYGPTGVAAGAGAGLLRSVHCNGDIQANVVPGDLTVNALIACAWDVANRRKIALSTEGSNTDIPVYNYVSVDNPITYDQLKHMSEKHGLQYPSVKAIWYYSFRNTKHRVVHLFYVYLLHLLPALLVDTVTVCLGKQPRLLKIYKKVHKFMDVLNYFSTREWRFSNENLRSLVDRMSERDKESFPCDIRKLDWDVYFQMYMQGIRVYLIKDPMDSLARARVRWQKLYWIHQSLKMVVAYGLLRICWFTFNLVLRSTRQ